MAMGPGYEVLLSQDNAFLRMILNLIHYFLEGISNEI